MCDQSETIAALHRAEKAEYDAETFAKQRDVYIGKLIAADKRIAVLKSAMRAAGLSTGRSV